MHAMSMQSQNELPDGTAKGRFLWFFCQAARSIEDADLAEFTIDFDESTLTWWHNAKNSAYLRITLDA